MNDEDREQIFANCDKLVSAINWPNIFPKLLERGVYHWDDSNVQRWQADLNSIETQRDIYTKITTRGPKAFRNFIQCLKDIGRDDLADILRARNNNKESYTDANWTEPGNNDPVTVNETIEGEPCKDDYYKKLRTTTEPLKVRVVKSKRSVPQLDNKVVCYAMSSIPRGLVLIINNVKFHTQKSRHGTQHDKKNLMDLFKQMGFRVVYDEDLTAEEMRQQIKTFSQRSDLLDVDSMFVIIMSHGNEFVSGNRSETIISGVDENFVTEREILNHFTASACENMRKKPKVFVFQTCRGKNVQQAVSVSNVSTPRLTADTSVYAEQTFVSTPIRWRNYSDMLVAYSTLPGHESYRDGFTGSWYIQILCEVMMNHAHNTEMSTMLQMADGRLEDMHNNENPACQTSEFANYGFKRLYLNPVSEGPSDI